MEARRQVCIQNATGLHARPCHAVVSLSLRFESEIRLRFGERDANGKSILELMTLEAPKGALIDLTARGPDAKDLILSLEKLFASGFEESS